MARGEKQRLLPKCDDIDLQLSVQDVIKSTPTRRVHRARSCASLRADVWTLLHYRTSLKQRSGLQRASYVFEVCVLVLITLNVVLAMYVSASPLGPRKWTNCCVAAAVTTSDWYEMFLYVSTALFTVEYMMRLWSCVEDKRFAHPLCGRLKWMLRPMSVIDLVVLIPFYLEILMEHQYGLMWKDGVLTLRGFRLLRIMSFLHLERSYQAMKNLREIFALKKEELAVVSYLTIVIVLTSSTTIFFLENPAQPEVFTSIGTCSWWAIETITSLGYGDIVPVTAAGRAFSSLLALWGIILFTIPGAVLGSGFVEVMLKKQEQKNEQAMEESIRISLTRELRSLSSSNLAFADPHEEKQKALLQRITGSVARLHEVIKEINTQIEVRQQN
ncbi:Voltage-gated potassium channel [Phytophthora cactorum]|nr:Voltage-gated potassium channel [Phytophthora cactorum]